MEIQKNFEDLYEVLDVHFGSNDIEIKKQYRKKIKYFSEKIKDGKHLNEEELWQVKLLKIAKYVLTSRELRDKYNATKIINSTEEEQLEENVGSTDNKFMDYEQDKFLPRKDQQNNYKELSDRQFERFEHKNVDITQDRMFRSES